MGRFGCSALQLKMVSPELGLAGGQARWWHGVDFNVFFFMVLTYLPLAFLGWID
jgi:hypothetical protein